MIIWHGRGFLIAIVGFGCLVVMELFTRAWFHDDTYYQRHRWPMLVGFLIAAGLVWLLGPSRNAEESVQSHYSPPAQSVIRDQDRLFFVSARHWPLVLGALGLACYVVSFFAQD